MPSYDLRCEACEHDFEVYRQGFLRDVDRICTACGAPDARQLFTGFVTARKGRGETPAPVGGGGCGAACGCGGH